MQVIENYIIYLEKLAKKPVPTRKIKPYIKTVELATNGQLYKTLRKDVPIAELLASGAFFTGEQMAEQVVAAIPAAELPTLTALDPTCGGGNLLLALARRMPLAETLADTTTQWGKQLYGMDIHLEFVRATRARLLLLANLRGLVEIGQSFFNGATPTAAEAFPNIFHTDSLAAGWPPVQYYLLNPPFNRVPVPQWCRWATGRVSQAALFIDKALKQAEKGSTIRAILPDVLRSGSNYNKWRRFVELASAIEPVQVLGQFDADTNVDVFLLHLTVEEQTLPPLTRWVNNQPITETNQTVGQLFQVGVGRVVPHRDAEEGPLYPYLDVHNVPAWQTLVAEQDERRFSGTVFTTPFVVIRRNSRAKDPFRAVGTIIAAKDAKHPEKVAVENHLIVLRPNSKKIADCEALLEKLRDPRTNEWLNECIRCRHLTVGSLQSIPWWPNV